jgi:hypothetical protein
MLIGASIRQEGQVASRELGLLVPSRLLTLPAERYQPVTITRPRLTVRLLLLDGMHQCMRVRGFGHLRHFGIGAAAQCGEIAA